MTSDQVHLRDYVPQDHDAVLQMDNSITVGQSWEVSSDGGSFGLALQTVDPAWIKRYDLTDDLTNPTWDQAWVAEAGTEIVAFACTRYEAWNRRQILMDLFVDGNHRGKGVGRTLMSQAIDLAARNGADHVWLETSNVNTLAVRFYEHLGFTISGFDLTHYSGISDAGEAALFLSLHMPTAGRPTQ
jgi:GNAT superfamily N-acetyltransferase